MHSADHEDQIQRFSDICRHHGLKITPQRTAVYRALIQSKHHPTADEMYRSVQEVYPHISFDTVNRTLATFAAIGVVDVVEGFGGAKRFDTDVGDHHHLHCIGCGRIIDFTHEDYNRIDVPTALTEKFQVISKRVVLKGYCDQCKPLS